MIAMKAKRALKRGLDTWLVTIERSARATERMDAQRRGMQTVGVDAYDMMDTATRRRDIKQYPTTFLRNLLQSRLQQSMPRYDILLLVSMFYEGKRYKWKWIRQLANVSVTN